MSDKKIYVFVLVSGDEIVAEADQVPTFGHNAVQGLWELHKPLKLFPVQRPVPSPEGIEIEVGVQILPAWTVTGRKTFQIHAENFLFDPVEAPQRLQSAWIQATTGLQVSANTPSKIITG